MPSAPILALVNPLSRERIAAQRAAVLAAALKRPLHLHAVVYRPEFAQELFRSGAALAERRRRRVAEAREFVSALAAELEVPNASVEAAWGHPFNVAAGETIARSAPTMVVFALRGGNRPSSAEWRLIRATTAPLLIVRDRRWRRPPIIAACLDPSHAHDKPAALDREIIVEAERLGNAFETPYHVLHALGLAERKPGSSVSPDRYMADLERRRAAQIRRMIPLDSRGKVIFDFAHAPPLEALDAFAKARRFDLCILGSLSRTRLKELLIGATLRELLPRLRSDVLLVRPPG